MKREIETVRNVIVVAIAAALLAFVIWTLAAADSRTSPPELPTLTPPPVDGTLIAPYPPPGDSYPPPYPPPGDGYPGPVFLPFSIGHGDSYP